jgi:hypothetical protein
MTEVNFLVDHEVREEFVITHDMGDAIPPPNEKFCILEWNSKTGGEGAREKTVMFHPGWEVREFMRDEYWVAVKMHTEFAGVCKAHNVTLPNDLLIIGPGDEPDDRVVIGFGSYGSEDPAHRAFIDCTIREAEWEMGDMKGPLPLIAMDMSEVPDEALAELRRRTGAKGMMGVVVGEVPMTRRVFS